MRTQVEFFACIAPRLRYVQLQTEAPLFASTRPQEPRKAGAKDGGSKRDFRSQERISPLETTYFFESFHAVEEQSHDSSPMTTYYDGDLAYIVENCSLRSASRQRRTLHSLDLDALLTLFSSQPLKSAA